MIISSVVPPLTTILQTAVNKIIGKVPMVVGPGIKTGLNILMDNPKAMGADLIVDSVAGINEYGAPLIIIADLEQSLHFPVDSWMLTLIWSVEKYLPMHRLETCFSLGYISLRETSRTH